MCAVHKIKHQKYLKFNIVPTRYFKLARVSVTFLKTLVKILSEDDNENVYKLKISWKKSCDFCNL